MEQNKFKLGSLGEKLAQTYFIKKGYYIIAKNARLSHKEVDLIINKGKEIRFIEVKTSYFNLHNQGNSPEDYISEQKIDILLQAIDEYSLILAKNKENIYLDVVTIRLFSNKMANIRYFKYIT